MNRRQIAQILEQGKYESAKIRVESIIREDINVELLEILELYCELLLARIGLMDAETCDSGLEEAVKSVIFAAPRTEIKELQQVRDLLVKKYGKEFSLIAIENSDGKVADRVAKKLKVEPPTQELVELYLQEIAKAYHVAYPPPTGKGADDGDDTPGGGDGLLEERLVVAEEELSHATPPKGPKSPIAVAPPNPSTDNLRPQVKLGIPVESKVIPPKPTQATAAPKKDNTPDFEELSRRFAALKKIP